MAQSGQKPTFDRLIASIPPESLDSVVRQEESVISLIAARAHCSPETLGNELGLKPMVIDDVVGEFSGDKIQQRGGVVRRWIQIDRKKATLKKLLDALYHCDEIEAIRQVNQTFSVSQDRRAPDMAATAFVVPVLPKTPASLLTARAHPSFGSQFSYGTSPVVQMPYTMDPMKLSFVTHPPQRALSTPASDFSDGSTVGGFEEPVSATVTGEGHLETAQDGRSILLTGATPGNGLQSQVRAAPVDAIAGIQQKMLEIEEKQENDTRAIQEKHESDMKTIQEQIQSLTITTQRKDEEQDEEIHKLQEENKSLRETLEAKVDEIDLLTSRLDEVQRRLEESESENEGLESENERLRTQLRKTMEEKQAVEHRLQKIQLDLKENGKDVPDSSKAESDVQQPGGVPAKWRKGHSLGKGSFGEVFVCEDTIMGRQLAVKVIPIKKGKTFETREVSLLKKLRHERIVLFYGHETEEVADQRGKTTTYLHIFMEYMPGESIHSYLETHGPLEEALARKFTVQLLEGVAYLHHKNVVHRDIKGANILRDSHGNIKLGDFGSSKELRDITVDGRNSYENGTAHWRAPESIRGDHVFKSDVWSVGATVMEMLTARPPFSTLSPGAVIFGVGNNRLTPTIDEEFSREARVFLQQCFKSEHSQRPSASHLLSESFCLLDPQD